LSLQRFIHGNQERLRGGNETWGMIGYALHSLGEDDATVDWLSDWRQRENIQPWMLSNLAQPLRILQHPEMAREVEVFACQLPPDHATDSLRLVKALDDVLEGNVADAARTLDPVDVHSLAPIHAFLHEFVGALLKLHLAPQEERDPVYADLEWRLTGSLSAHRGFLTNPVTGDTIRRCLRGIARQRGGTRAALWAWALPRMPQVVSLFVKPPRGARQDPV
jgi:hypothetical protein